MASTMSKPKTHQQLGELLQQKQEPFVLDLYLLERGYLKKSLSSKLEFGCCHNRNHNKLSFKGIPRCSRILRAIFKKFTRSIKRKNSESTDDGRGAKFSVNEKRNSKEEVAEQNRLSSVSITTLFNSCSDSDKDELSPTSLSKHYDSVLADTLESLRLSNMTEEDEEACAGREFQCHVTSNNKQLSPDSVLPQIPQSKHELGTRQHQESETTCTIRLPNKLVVVDSSTMLSTSLCQLHCQEFVSDKSIRGIIDDDPMKLVGSNNRPSPQFVKSKRMLQQTKQLLFDCVKEIVESHAIDSNSNEKVKKSHNKGLIGPEQLGGLILERMKAWDSHFGNESNSFISSLDFDISDSACKEWKNAFDFEKRKVCSEIGDSIAEAIIDEIVVEILNPKKILQ